MIATSSDDDAARPQFISRAEYSECHTAAYEAHGLADPSWFIRNLTPIQKAFLDAAVLLAGNRLRFGESLRTGFVVRAAKHLYPDWSTTEFQQAMAKLQKANIIELCGNEFRLTRRVDKSGMHTHEEHRVIVQTMVDRPRQETPKQAATRIRLARKQAVIERHGSWCVYCRKSMHPKKVTIDHVHPRALGGEDEGNLVPCCESCNLSKRDRTPEQWARDILRWNRPRRTKPKHVAITYLSVTPAFAISWLVSILTFAKGGVR